MVTDDKKKRRKSLATNRRRAKKMRHAPVATEDLFWSCVRNRKLGGFKFKRQVLIGPYIADFVCLEKRVVIELDGPLHKDRKQYDALRDRFLADAGFKVMRIRNDDLAGALAATMAFIKHTLAATTPSPRPLPHFVGERENPRDKHHPQ